MAYSIQTMLFFFIAEREILSAVIISYKSEHAKGCDARDEESFP